MPSCYLPHCPRNWNSTYLNSQAPPLICKYLEIIGMGKNCELNQPVVGVDRNSLSLFLTTNHKKCTAGLNIMALNTFQFLLNCSFRNSRNFSTSTLTMIHHRNSTSEIQQVFLWTIFENWKGGKKKPQNVQSEVERQIKVDPDNAHTHVQKHIISKYHYPII